MNDNNNLNMDDLFRRAANDYPLRTDSADWDKVLGAMDEDDGSSLVLPYEQDGRRSRRRFLWLLLLLPLGGLGYYTWQGRHAAHTAAVAPSEAGGYTSSKAPERTGPTMGVSEPSSERSATGDKTGVNKKGDDKTDNNRNNRLAKDNHSGTDLSANRLREDTASGRGASGNGALKSGNEGAAIPTNGHGGKVVSGIDHSAKIIPGKNHTANGLSTNDLSTNDLSDRNVSGEDGSASALHTSTGNHGNKHSGKRNRLKMKDDAEKGFADTDQKRKSGARSKSVGSKQTNTVDSTYVHTARSLQNSPMAGVVPLTGILSLNIRVSDKSMPNGVEKPAAKPVKKTKNSSFYAGLLGAPDMSYVKFQSVKGVGYNIGLLLGYNFNRKLALETGVYYDHKKYYTDGEYFSKKNIYTPPNYYLQNVDGSCNMWEIPLNFRYNFGKGEKVKWFATTGLSTYLMTKEQYSYEYENTTTGVSRPYDWTGKNNSNYLFSVFNFSIGYEQSLGKIGNLRLEPYLRVPLAGFGKGSLPIMSSGLNIGITRRIW